MASKSGNQSQVHELLYQALETEMGGILIYKAAISCATNKDLRKEWESYLEETQTHHEVLLNVFNELGLDPAAQTPGRKVVSHLGESLVAAIKLAKASGDAQAAQLVAAECVVLAETKDHSNWELIGLLADKLPAKEAKILNQAYEAVNEDEEHHLYHTKGWARELWIESLGFPAVLPPPEEVKDVETAIGAARAQQSREKMLGKRH